ncbi:MAG: hypothetical protein ABI780_09715 [Ardenticatenales bacterium]
MSYPNTLPSDLVVTCYDPARALVGPVTDYDQLRVKRTEFGQAITTFDLPLESDVLAAVYSGSSAYARALSGYTFDVYYWGGFFARGVAVICDDDDEEDGGSTIDDIPSSVQVECWELHHWVLSGRTIMGTAGNRYTPATAKADNVLRAMWRANMVAGPLVEPAEYSSGVLDPTTGVSTAVSRTNFGPFTVAVEADTTSHPTTVTHRWDHGRSLWDNTVEFCRRYGLRPYYTLSGTTITLRVAYPNPGTDRTASVRFTREMGNLIRFGRKVDRGATSNIAECRGKGRRTAQIRQYAQHKQSYDDVGARETTEVWRSADGTDAQNNASWIITQVGGAETHYRAKLVEIDTQKWGDFDLGDKITIYDSRRAATVADYITSLELQHDADDVPELAIATGREPQNEDKKMSRGGGGGGGGHARGGGHPKNADGEATETIVAAGSCITVTPTNDTDAGTITYTIATSGFSFGAITVDDGTLTPDSCWKALEIKGARCIEVIRVDADTINIRNTKYWINKISIDDPAFTLTADQCDEEVVFKGAGGIVLSGAGNTITITGPTHDRYVTINGDSGTASASGADTLLIKGVDGIKTVAGDASPDQLGISIRLPQCTSSEASPKYHKVWDDSGNPRAVKTYVPTS